MKSLFMSFAAAFSLLGGTAMAQPEVDALRSRIYHINQNDFRKDSSGWNAEKHAEAKSGKHLLQAFPVGQIKAIEVEGDEVDAPTHWVLSVLRNARFGAPMAVPPASLPKGRIQLQDGRCLQFSISCDDIGCAHSVRCDGWMLKLDAYPACTAQVPKLKAGMKRSDVEKLLGADGGISVPFKYERYVNYAEKCTEMEKVKMNFAFKPAGMTDAVYYLGKWVPPKPSPDDVVMRISPAYSERPYTD
jgi:hypothetical protein